MRGCRSSALGESWQRAGSSYGDEDHAQWFGLPAPLDGLEETNRLLLNRTAQKMEIRAETSDLILTFSGHRVLELLNLSCGYEAWQLIDESDSWIVAQGGGKLVVSTIYRG